MKTVTIVDLFQLTVFRQNAYTPWIESVALILASTPRDLLLLHDAILRFDLCFVSWLWNRTVVKDEDISESVVVMEPYCCEGRGHQRKRRGYRTVQL